jgi:hypothetical protein
MIFAFDFPHKNGNKFSRPHYNRTKVKFNGLIDLPKNREPYFGPAPPSLVDLCIKFDKSFQVLSSESAIALCPPDTGKSFYYLLETQGPPEYWLGNKDGYENTLLSGVNEKVIHATQSGQCKIILWSANEGYDPFQYEIFDNIYKDLEEYEIPLENFIYISGNLIIDVLHMIWGSLNGMGNLVKSIPFNNELYDSYEKIQPSVIFDEGSKDRDKYFLLLNRSPRIHRMALISWLHSKSLLENTFTSYPSEKLSPYKFSKRVHLSRYFSNHLFVDKFTKSDALQAWKDLENNHLPLIVDVEEWGTNHYGTSADWLYSRTFFSVITESVFDDLSLFLDEKVWKPIYNYHPFIILGCPNSLKKLKEFGFKTFHPLINESYDTEFNHGKRMGMIVDEVERLCSMSFDELKTWYKELIPILKHNRDVLYNNELINGVFDEL